MRLRRAISRRMPRVHRHRGSARHGPRLRVFRVRVYGALRTLRTRAHRAPERVPTPHRRIAVLDVQGLPASRRNPWRPSPAPTYMQITPGGNWGSRRGFGVRPCTGKLTPAGLKVNPQAASLRLPCRVNITAADRGDGGWGVSADHSDALASSTPSLRRFHQQREAHRGMTIVLPLPFRS